ncbi:glycerate kinase [Thermococcus sp. AM4]|uniref:glycerate kinase type-2 family protein n=1 Tax=Thermococcus sp. (strain AM4) TaxID=246969 RepID=UPI000187031B|nr:glycerate kinase [Thermococcus sp. AM4]EEB74556.1 D-glycerate 2-kinase [Thermococcus sp. AM4]
MVVSELISAALKAADPYLAVIEALRFRKGTLSIGGESFPVCGRVHVLAVGKASCRMAKAVFETLPRELIGETLVVTKHGYAIDCEGIEARIIEAGHPIPDENSLLAGKLGLELAEKVGRDDILLTLISGGGSALFVYPAEGVSLEDLIRTNELLLRSGATIREINTVRKHLSKVKGGRLAKAVKGTVVSLIVSDVVGDEISSIASGITSPDPTTYRDAYEVLVRRGIWDRVPESVRRVIERGMRGEIEETPKELGNVHNFLIAGNSKACEAVARKAEELGFNSTVITTTLEGEAKEVALAVGSIIEEIVKRDRPLKKPAVLVFGGEWTVTVGDAKGLGGPNQEFALSIARKIAGLNVTVVAFDTDGTDGPTDAAGGIVDGGTLKRLEEAGVDVEEALRDHDSYRALERAGALLKTGPTGTNVNSMVIAIIPDPSIPSGGTGLRGPELSQGR